MRWAVSTEILLEYEEVAARLTNPGYVALVFQTMDAVDAVRRNILLVSPTFRFQLVKVDSDDNRFADCAIVADADFIITEDRHFEIMRASGYKPQPIAPAEFIRLHLSPQ